MRPRDTYSVVRCTALAEQWRADKTLDKMRRGALPTPTDHASEVGTGDGTPCTGCGETIQPGEQQHLVLIKGGLRFRFHASCYTAWATPQA
jgi:hypothetical protein